MARVAVYSHYIVRKGQRCEVESEVNRLVSYLWSASCVELATVFAPVPFLPSPFKKLRTQWCERVGRCKSRGDGILPLLRRRPRTGNTAALDGAMG